MMDLDDELIETTNTASPVTASASPMKNDVLNGEDAFLESLIVEAEDAAKEEQVYKILSYAMEGVGKTHFGMTMPEPIYFLESELDKAKIIVGKFASDEQDEDGNDKIRDIKIIQWRDTETLKKIIPLVITRLKEEKKKTGRTGSIVVDSFSLLWELSQKEYRLRNNKPLSARLSPRDDYSSINAIHNEIRDLILDSGFHVYGTARGKNLYEDANDTFKVTGMGASGQKENPFAFDWTLEMKKNETGEVHTVIKKTAISGKTTAPVKNVTFPTFLKIVGKLKDNEGYIVSEID